MTSISTSSPRPLPNPQAADPRSKLENLYRTLGELRKQLRSLHKRLEETGNVAEQMAIREQIRSVEEMVEAIRQQIMVITLVEKRKQPAQPAIAGVEAASRSARGDKGSEYPEGTYKPPYAPSD
jgi:hypothetical protein